MPDQARCVSRADVVHVMTSVLDYLRRSHTAVDYRLVGTAAALLHGVDLPAGDIDILVRERGALITLAVQKTREIGILKSLGASAGTIVRIFVFQGAVVGAFGTVLGAVLGVTLLHYRNEFLRLLSRWTGRDLLPQDLYRLPEIPAQLSPRDLLVICASALIICTLAGLAPAWRSSRLDPAQALRYE